MLVHALLSKTASLVSAQSLLCASYKLHNHTENAAKFAVLLM